MASFGEQGFNAEAPENNEATRQVLPAGEYDVIVVNSQKKETRAGTGAYLSLEMQITSGEFQNRRLFHNLNLWLREDSDDRKMAVKIAKGQLSELCRAVGVLTPRDSSELHNKPLRVKVTVKESAEYGPQNNVKKFSARPNAYTPPLVAPEPVHAAAAADPNASPWG
jgi:hypothetical protein